MSKFALWGEAQLQHGNKKSTTGKPRGYALTADGPGNANLDFKICMNLESKSQESEKMFQLLNLNLSLKINVLLDSSDLATNSISQ